MSADSPPPPAQSPVETSGAPAPVEARGTGERPERRLWRDLLLRLRLRDRRFFPLFNMHARLCVEGMRALVDLLGDLEDPRGLVREIEALEKRADGIVDEVHAALRRSLFPPHPRSSIVELINRLDDILDLTEDAAQTVHLYHVTALTPEALRLAQLALDAVQRIERAVALLSQPAQAQQILSLCNQIDDLEAQADHVLRAAMSKLFREEPDARELIKLRAVYEVLEELTDVCKDVAAEMESIVLGHIGS